MVRQLVRVQVQVLLPSRILKRGFVEATLQELYALAPAMRRSPLEARRDVAAVARGAAGGAGADVGAAEARVAGQIAEARAPRPELSGDGRQLVATEVQVDQVREGAELGR